MGYKFEKDIRCKNEVLEWCPWECKRVHGRYRGRWVDDIRKKYGMRVVPKQRQMEACWRGFYPAVNGAVNFNRNYFFLYIDSYKDQTIEYYKLYVF